MLKWILLYLLAAVIAYFVLAIFVEDEPYDDWDDARIPNWIMALLWGVLAPVALVFTISWYLTIGSRKLSNKIYNYFHKEDI